MEDKYFEVLVSTLEIYCSFIHVVICKKEKFVSVTLKRSVRLDIDLINLIKNVS